jgi:hypothetical protein
MPDRAARPETGLSGTEVEVTPEMLAAGGRIIADSYGEVLDWLTYDRAAEIYVAMYSVSPSAKYDQQY